MSNQYVKLVNDSNKEMVKELFETVSQQLADNKSVDLFMESIIQINENILTDFLNRHILPEIGTFIAFLQKILKKNNLPQNEIDSITSTVEQSLKTYKNTNGKTYQQGLGI